MRANVKIQIWIHFFSHCMFNHFCDRGQDWKQREAWKGLITAGSAGKTFCAKVMQRIESVYFINGSNLLVMVTVFQATSTEPFNKTHTPGSALYLDIIIEHAVLRILFTSATTSLLSLLFCFQKMSKYLICTNVFITQYFDFCNNRSHHDALFFISPIGLVIFHC